MHRKYRFKAASSTLDLDCGDPFLPVAISRADDGLDPMSRRPLRSW
jgi:hypothetical protein